MIITDFAPMAAHVEGLPEQAFFGGNQCVEMTRVARRRGDGNAPQRTFGKAFTQLFPSVAAVGAAIDTASFAAIFESPGIAAEVPHCGIEHLRVVTLRG